MFSLDGYQSVLAHGGIVRRADRGVLAVAGADRATWLQGLVTNDVAALKDGESCYAAYLTPQGRMISDMHVVASGQRMLLDVPAPLAGALRDRLDGLVFSEDVRVTDESDALRVWTVVLADRFVEVIGGAVPAPYGSLPEIDLDTFEVIRIERGVPKFLVDMTQDTIPLEAGIEDRAISFTKGCYVGQEIIVRVTHRGGGRVAKKLVRWLATADASAVPAPGSKIVAADKEAGWVTSAAFSPRLNSVVGLGYVHREFIGVGADLSIRSSDGLLLGARLLPAHGANG